MDHVHQNKEQMADESGTNMQPELQESSSAEGEPLPGRG